MGRLEIKPTGRERFFDEDEIIVSKTDLTGKITYANRVFQKVAQYTEEELLGQPHSLIRHPDMPRAVFAYLWQTIAAGQEVFAYVKNLARSGDHYWVLAHVTPTYSVTGQIISYHSSRRVPARNAVTTAEGIYAALLAEEAKYPDRREGLEASLALLGRTLQDAGMSYDRLVWTLDPTAVT
ncbi:MAG: PAS domain-containing protein [Gemmatimonadales bacterium]